MVRALRAAGHDVAAIAEDQPGLADRDVIARSEMESRIVLAEDKDFGQLSFSAGRGSVGCVLLRFPAGVRASLGADGQSRTDDLVIMNGLSAVRWG